MDQQLFSLIESSYSTTEAEIVLSFRPSNDDVQLLIHAGKKALNLFPNIPGACALMTAMWVACIRSTTKYPIYAIAGSLLVDGIHVFGRTSSANQVKEAFTSTNLDWDGHCWLIFGNLIGDISLFRTAYSDKSPPALKEKVMSVFGEGCDLLINQLDSLAKLGIVYHPQYALRNDEITHIVNGARTIIERQTGI
jgi:hypothetical protein